MIDIAAGDDIPRKRGLGMLQADLLVVNKIDLAPHVGADLERMRADVALARPERPSLFTDLRDERRRRDGVRPRSATRLFDRAPAAVSAAAGGCSSCRFRAGRAGRTVVAARRQRFPLAHEVAALPRRRRARDGVPLHPEPDRRRVRGRPARVRVDGRERARACT